MSAFEFDPSTPKESTLCVCAECRQEFVNVVNWFDAGENDYIVELECTNCNQKDIMSVSDEIAEAHDYRVDEHIKLIASSIERLELVREIEEIVDSEFEKIDNFAMALQDDHILPEDF